MSERKWVTVDGNEAAAYVAHKSNEVIAIYPITPSSPMGEFSDEWSAQGRKNVFGVVPDVIELQSEGGASASCHGAIQAGALTTTFTASQGLLLMIPNMFKIAGELSPTVFHIAARTLATHALSIFGDHSDVMSVRSTGWAMLASNSVGEAHDMAMIAQSATLKSRVPFLHFFDGFRTSHEVNKIELLSDDDIRAMLDEELIKAHRERAMNPDKPVLRGTAQNPDVFFQAREACNPFYDATPAIVQETMDRFAKLVGRQYHLFDYVGAPDADRIVVLMGSGVGAVGRNRAEAEQDGPEGGRAQSAAVPAVRRQGLPGRDPHVRQRHRRAGSHQGAGRGGRTAVSGHADGPDGRLGRAGRRDAKMPLVIGGRYGLSSKEFTPAMVKAVLDELNAAKPKNHFTVGIVNDVTHTSLKYDPEFHTDEPDVRCSLFYGLGADGTVGANKNSVKIIGENTDLYAQGYFVYDSKKAGAITVSHLRFSPRPIESTYLIERASFVACHQFVFLERVDVLGQAEVGATFLLNSPFGPDEVWDRLPQEVQETIIQKKLKFYVIDGYGVAKAAGMGGRVNTVMQTCFFALANVLPREEAIEQIKYAIKKTYGKRGEAIVQKNFAAVDASIANLHEVKVPDKVTSTFKRLPAVWGDVPDFVERVTGMIIAGKGDLLPVSALPVDGTFPTATAKYEKRSIALEIPMWDPKICIQCGLCSLVCPHAAIRTKAYPKESLNGRPGHVPSRWTTRAKSWRTTCSRSRSRPTTVPAAACASTSARPRARRRSSTRPSTWRRSWITSRRNRKTSSTS